MRRLLFPLLILLTACSTFAPPRWHSLSDPADRSVLLDRIFAARVVFVGEFHDRRTHHDLQLSLIRLLNERGDRIAVGLEMFSIESQTVLDHWVAGRIPLEEFVEYYRRHWTIDWEEYGAILRYARNHGIPVVGLNAPQDLVMKVSRSGWNSLSAADRARLPRGVSPAVTPSYRSFISEAFGSHGMDPGRFQWFVEAQGLRNSTMALAIGEALRTHPDRKLIVITGMGHAVRGGITAALPPETAAKSLIIFPWDDRMEGRIDPQDADLFIVE